MIGNPKYKEGQLVKFSIFNQYDKQETHEGVIYIVDKYGVFEDDSEVHYDIMCDNENTLYKHIKETSIL